MNILFYRYNSIYEPDMINAFKKAGLNVIEITDEIRNKDISDSRRIRLLEAAMTKYEPLFVYGINYYPAIAEICRILKVMYLSQTVDSPILTLFDRSICNGSNRIFLFDRAQYNMFSQFNPDGIFHLPLAAATERFDEVIKTISSDDISRFSSDISFVGSTYREKDPLAELTGLSSETKEYINALAETVMNQYGYYPVRDSLDKNIVAEIKKAAGSRFPQINDPVTGFDDYVVSHRYIGSHIAVLERESILNKLAGHFNVDLYTRSDTSSLNGVNVHPGVNTLTEMPKIFNLSKINLNITMRPIETGLPLRCFDILGCGGFLMTNYQPEIEELFVVGEDLEIYSCHDELIDKCSYYLTHDDERSAIARNGYEKVKAAHTHMHRLQQMLKTIT